MALLFLTNTGLCGAPFFLYLDPIMRWPMGFQMDRYSPWSMLIIVKVNGWGAWDHLLFVVFDPSNDWLYHQKACLFSIKKVAFITQLHWLLTSFSSFLQKNALIGGAITGAVISAASNDNRDKVVVNAITGGAIATAAEFLNYLTWEVTRKVPKRLLIVRMTSPCSLSCLLTIHQLYAVFLDNLTVKSSLIIIEWKVLFMHWSWCESVLEHAKCWFECTP